MAEYERLIWQGERATMLAVDFSKYSFWRRLLSVLLIPWYVVSFVVTGKFRTM